jgi:type II secretory pathway component GspD/PulD (secretin)
MFRAIPIIFTVILLLVSSNSVQSSSIETVESPAAAVEEPGIPLQTIIRAVARKTGKKFVIDARVHGNVELVGQDVGAVTYSELLAILQQEGFTAVEGGDVLSVIPEAIVRQTPLPVVVGSARYPDAQYVSAVIPVHNVPAATLIPVLRPLLPQQAHLAAVVCSNAILMVDTFANIRRIESLIVALDTGDSYKGDKCDGASHAP